MGDQDGLKEYFWVLFSITVVFKQSSSLSEACLLVACWHVSWVKNARLRPLWQPELNGDKQTCGGHYLTFAHVTMCYHPPQVHFVSSCFQVSAICSSLLRELIARCKWTAASNLLIQSGDGESWRRDTKASHVWRTKGSNHRACAWIKMSLQPLTHPGSVSSFLLLYTLLLLSLSHLL